MQSPMASVSTLRKYGLKGSKVNESNEVNEKLAEVKG